MSESPSNFIDQLSDVSCNDMPPLSNVAKSTCIYEGIYYFTTEDFFHSINTNKLLKMHRNFDKSDSKKTVPNEKHSTNFYDTSWPGLRKQLGLSSLLAKWKIAKHREHESGTTMLILWRVLVHMHTTQTNPARMHFIPSPSPTEEYQ